MTEVDCLVVGAGPAGLTAAIYLARFRRSVAIYDVGHSRAAYIPVSHNYAGFPHGISGVDLLVRLREQAARHGVHVTEAHVDSLERDGGDFIAAEDSRMQGGARDRRGRPRARHAEPARGDPLRRDPALRHLRRLRRDR
jgi:thioredoxin reductase